MLCSNAFAQVFVKSSSQELIESAIKNSMFIIRQNYQLKDSVTNEYFGLAGKEEFGISYSLGIKLQGGYCVTDQAVRPWEYDENYSRYRTTHIPIINKTEYLGVNADGKYQTLSFLNQEITPLLSEKLYMVKDSTFSGNGFFIDSSKGNKEGWVVYIAAEKSIYNVEIGVNPSYFIYRKDINLDDGKKEYRIDNPLTNQKIWGGFYLVPEQTAIGQITFKLVGLLVGHEKEWKIVTPFESLSDVSVLSQDEEKSVLTPVKSKNDDGKTEKKKRKSK